MSGWTFWISARPLVHLAATALAVSTANAAAAEEFDWQKRSSQEQMHQAFVGTSRVCAALFGFSLVPVQPQDELVDKLYAHLLLRDRPVDELAKWTAIVRPISAVMAEKSGDTAPDDRKAAAAAVAASEDPTVFDEAKVRYLANSMAPFRRALAACEVGARDPFLGKHYLTGTGSAAEQERHLSEWFSEFVSDLRKQKTSRQR